MARLGCLQPGGRTVGRGCNTQRAVLARELHNVIQFDGIGVAQYDEKEKRVTWHVSERCSQPIVPEEGGAGESIACWVYQNQQPLTIPYVDRETRFPGMIETLRRYGIQSACALPLTVLPPSPTSTLSTKS